MRERFGHHECRPCRKYFGKNYSDDESDDKDDMDDKRQSKSL